jgi:hypothetical protein
MSNPFEIKQYYIRESPYKPCSSLPLPSRITIRSRNIEGIIKNTNKDVKGFSSKGPLSLLEIKQYLLHETTKFYVQAELAKSCDSAGLALNGVKGAKASSIPPVCKNNFTNFSDKNLRLIQMAIDNKTTAFTTQMGVPNPFTNFEYTPKYLKSKRIMNDKKQLCQRYTDIGQLLADFLVILNTINNNNQKTMFMDEYIEMIEIYKNNGHLRTELKNKLDNLTTNIYYQESKEFLDSTVYINVLWTILATMSLFYIFKSLNDS